MATRSASTYGARGDGKTDDAAAIQRLFGAAKPGDVLTFAGTKRYRVTKGPILTCPDVRIWFNGATLLLDTSVYPDNSHLRIQSQIDYANPLAEFDATIPAGWYALPPRSTTVWLMLGTDPDDGNEEHFGALVAPTESRVWLPYAISGTHHKMLRCDRVCERVSVRDLRVDTVAGKVANANVCFSGVRNCELDGLKGNVTIGALVTDSEHVRLSNFDVDLTYTHTSAGRAVGAWQSRYFDIDRITYRGITSPTKGAAGFFFESWCGHACIDHVDATLTPSPGTLFPAFFVNGGCYDFSVPFVRITTPGEAYLWDVGGQAGNVSPRFGTVEVVGGTTGQIEDYRNHGWLNVEEVVRTAPT